MAETATRRSVRVAMAIPIEILGTDVSGEYFVQQGETVMLSRHGASILVNRRLAPTQEMVIRHLTTNKEAECRVVGQIAVQAGGWVYGIAFLDPNVDLWGIEFPPPPPPEDVVGRLLLQCGGCKTRKVTYLNELELEVVQANRVIALYCKRCRDTSLWKEAEYERRSDLPVGCLPVHATEDRDERPQDPNVIGVQEAPRAENERAHLRVKTAIVACIRAPGRGDEVVETVNVSRGGFCFNSAKHFALGLRVEVALPYTPDSANIFIPGRIVRMRPLYRQQESEYGVAYGHEGKTSSTQNQP